MKKTNGTSHWPVYHSSMGPKYGYLNLTNAFVIGSGEMWNYTEPNDHYVTLKGEPNTFGSAGDVIMYCWHDVPGLHKSGTYRGFNSSNGPVIDLGFRPAIILLKKLTNTDSNSGWHWYDNKRNTSNPANNFLLAGHAYYENRAANNTADVSGYTVDFTSNGFRMSHGSNNLNNTNETYFYAAWAEAPTDNLYGAQSNAR